MTLRIALLPLALSVLALPAPLLASPHGRGNVIVHAYPQGYFPSQPPATYVVRPQTVVVRPQPVVVQPRYQQVQPIYQPVQPRYQRVRPRPAVYHTYAPHPGFQPTVVNHYGHPVSNHHSGGFHGQPTPTLAGGNGLFQQPRTCQPFVPLAGAALGGTVGAVMASNSRDRRWALPMGAAVGGIIGGVASGC